LLKILLPFVWVPSEAGEMLRQEVRRPRPRRAVALEVGRIRNLSPRLPRVDPGEGGEFPCVPELFARRACSTYPPWKVLSLNVTWSHDLSADLERSLRDLALDALDATYWPDAYDADQLRDELREFVKSHGPILVVLPKS